MDFPSLDNSMDPSGVKKEANDKFVFEFVLTKNG